MKRLSSIVLCLIGVSAVCSAQQNGGEIFPEAGASVSGIVTGVTGEPLPDATLVLEVVSRGTGVNVPPKPPPAYSTLTDAQGRFEFPSVTPAVYEKLSVKLAGYSEQSRRGEGEMLGRLRLSSGQKVTGVAFKLVREAVITGRILDQGKPVSGLRVTAARRIYPPDRAPLRTELTVMTGEDGTFSFSLPSGVYYVRAMSQDGEGGEAYIASYYPSAADPSDATGIPVTVGETVHLADMRLRKSRVYRIRGKIIDAASGAFPQGQFQVDIHPQDPPDYRLGSSSGGNGLSGMFEAAFFAPGVYIVDARPNIGPLGVKPPLSFTGRRTVTVTNADVDMVLKVSPALEITGRVSPGGPGRIRLGSVDGISFAGIGEFQTDGAFAIYSLAPTVYRIRSNYLPDGMYIKSIHYGDVDVTSGLLDLTPGVKGPLKIELAPDAASIAGTVRDADGTALPGVSVRVWVPGSPTDAAADFVQAALSGAHGQFQFTNLAPGEYVVAAWAEIDSKLAARPAIRPTFESQATPVKLNEGDRVDLVPALIPSRE